MQVLIIFSHEIQCWQVLRNQIFSVRKAQEFLGEMSKTTESDCDCLPDCDLMDLQYSLSTTDLMWVKIAFRHKTQDTGRSFKENLFRQCDSRNLNLNPLCMLKPGSLPALWTERVLTDTIHSKDHFWYSDNFLFSFAGKKDLQNIWQVNSLLHLRIGEPNEEETQGQSAFRWVNGKSSSAIIFVKPFPPRWTSPCHHQKFF